MIHTTKTAGIMYGIGHKDFWPNHGIEQPGCDFYQADCGHQRSIHLFVESTEGEHKFVSVKCTGIRNLLVFNILFVSLINLSLYPILLYS